MLSLLAAAQCIGVGPPFSLAHDFFGFWGSGPRQVSLRTQIQRLRDRHVHLNFIAIGLLDGPDHAFLDQGLQKARDILSAARIGIGRVEYHAIADNFVDQQSPAKMDEEYRLALAAIWKVSNGGIDVFVCHEILGNTNGVSPVGGSCGDSGANTGLLVGASDTGDGPGMGQVLAHELGHFFGLHHYGEIKLIGHKIQIPSDNLMCFASDPSRTELFPWQIWLMRQHCSMRGGCAL